MSSMTNPPPGNAPYRAVAPGAGFGAMGKSTRRVFAVLVGLMMLCFGSAVTAWTTAMIAAEHTENRQPEPTLLTVGIVSFFVLMFLLYGQIAAGLVWVYKAWSWLPWDQRYTRHWRSWLTPSQVALMLLIPYFHYYWMFVANCGLCDALDRMRVSYPTSRPAPKGLAIAACVCQLVIPFPVGSILWLVFMTRIEKMTAEMSASMAPRYAATY
jgi:hypothetical protein